MIVRVILIYCVAFALFLSCTPAQRYSPAVGPVTTEVAEPETESVVEQEPDGFAGDVPTRVDIATMDRIIAKYLSVPYKRGGTGKLGFDCSGFVYVVYRDYDGTRLPITVRSLFRLEDRVEFADLAYGDLLFFKPNGRKVSHVGIYLGGGKFVHASESRGVAFDDLNDNYFRSGYAGARRLK